MNKEDHRELGVNCYNHCWELLETEHRTRAQDDDLLESSFVQRYHWFMAGGPDQFVMADWMVSRAAAATGHGDLALHYAQLAYERAQSPTTPDWLKASVAEGMARAYAVAGDGAQREHWFAAAKDLVDAISDREDRELIASQLSSVPH